MTVRTLSLSSLLAVLLASSACGQQPAVADTAPPPVPREMRAAWVATVENMDWPSKKGLSTRDQQAELTAILDRLVALHMNAVVLQVRPAADALYDSKLEPWSDVLTGVQGRAPSPWYDPLAFAVAEAHRRGLELHAWINPYRAQHPSTKQLASSHVGRTRPELVHQYGPYFWMDPGEPAVRAITTQVVLDLVRRYDLDGVHMDDYFYPYPESRGGREIEFPDSGTYARYRRAGGTLSRDDWRRHNVDLLVKGLNDSIHALKPWVRFGISPFGIWRPGYPASVRGLDQFAVLYADARKWLREGWVDYFTPQLYWAVNRPEQRYDQLLAWWSEQNVHHRHLWPGNYTSKVGFTTASRWEPAEVLEQIRLTRAQPGATGNVHFSMEVFMKDPARLNERLVREAYPTPALVPASPWLDAGAPARFTATERRDSSSGAQVVDLRPESGSVIRGWVVQRRGSAGWSTTLLPGGTQTVLLAARGGSRPSQVRVTPIDRVGVPGSTIVLGR